MSRLTIFTKNEQSKFDLPPRLTKKDRTVAFAVTNERNGLIGLISAGSVICWSHVNLHGEYNFESYAANDDRFDMKRILSLNVG